MLTISSVSPLAGVGRDKGVAVSPDKVADEMILYDIDDFLMIWRTTHAVVLSSDDDE